MYLKLIKHIGLVALVAVLAGCASGVTRLDVPVSNVGSLAQPIDTKVKSVTLWLNGDATERMAESDRFKPDALKATIERELNAQGGVKADSVQTLDIEITGFRIRHTANAVIFGFMAGADSVDGIVTIKDGSGNALKKAKVSASYALGGWGGGIYETRMNWLYDKIAKQAVSEVTGTVSK